MSIAALLGMPAARGLFQRAILQSGAAGELPSGSEATRVARALLSKLNVDPARLEALDELPLEVLLKLQPELGREFGEVRAFSPVIDGETLPQHPLAMLAQGSARDVAVLLGTNRDEWRLFALLSGGAQADEQLLTRLFGDSAQQVLSQYIAAREDHSPELAWIDLMGDLVFRIPAIRLAEAQVRQGAPVWMYRFDWQSPVFGGVLGAAHAMDIPFVFNTLDVGLSRLFTGTDPRRQALADLMQASWAAFIRSGDPALPGQLDWPRYDLDRRATLIWDEQPSLVEDPRGELRVLWDRLSPAAS